MWLPLIFTLAVVYLAFAGQHARDLNAQWVLHTVEVKDQVEHLNSLVRDIGAGERGYLLTGDASLLPLYENALKEIPTQSDQLAHLIEDNPRQVTAVANLQTLIAEKLSIAAQALSSAQKEKLPETMEMYRDTQGKSLNDEIRAQVEAITAEEDRLLSERENVFTSQVKSERNEMIGLVAVEIALIIGLTLLMHRLRKLQLTADARIGEAHAMTDQAQAGTFKAMVRTEQAEVRTAEANTRTQEAEIRGEEAVRASELRYRRLFETAQDGIIVLDALTGGVVDANPFMKDLLGYSQEEMLGRKLWEIGPFKGAAASKIAFSNLVKSGRIQSENLSLETKDGRQIEVEFISSAYHMDDNLLVQCNIRNITERKRAEQNLTLLHTCISNLNDIVLITEADSAEEPGPRIVFVNEAFERTTGYTSAETLGQSPRFLQGPKTDRRILDEIHQAVAQQKPIRRQIINYRKDGTEFWLDIDIVPIFDAAGKCTHFVGIERDVTLEKKTEEQLRWQAAFFEAQVNSALDGILIVNREGNKILQNQRMVDLWNIPRDIADQIDDQAQLDWITDQVRNPGQFAGNVAYLYAHPDEIGRDELQLLNGTFFERYTAPVLDKEGKYYGRIWTYRDITERRRMENELVESESKFRLLAENIADVFWIASPDLGKMYYVSPAYHLIWGRSAESLYAHPREWIEAILPEDRERVRLVFAKLKQNEPSVSVEYRIVRPDGSVRWIHDRGFQVLDAKGELTHLTGIATDITEREREENVRRETEKRYRTLFDYAPDGILIVSPENIYIDANVSMCKMLGYARDELIGLTAQDIVAETDHPRIDSALSVIRGKIDHHREWKFRRKDGSVFEVDAFSTLMPDGNVLAMIRDITERKRNEARFRRLVDSNAQGVIFWNSKGDITGANDAFLHLVRYTREDLEAGRLDWTEMTPPEYAHLDLHSMAQIAVGGVGTPYEKEFIRKDGVRVSVLIGGANFEDSPEEGVAFVLDLTERKCAAEQIAEQAALLDEAQDAIIVCDLEGKIIFWNKGAERMYGWTRQEVLGVNMSEILFAKPKKFAEVNALTISEGKWSGDLQHFTKDKREITIEARWTLIREKDGNPKSILAINTDVTEKKKTEAQFMRAQRMESIGTLAGGIAHDLNNILSPIMMSIDILKMSATDPQAISILDTIEVSSKRGSDIVRQVLSFARGLEGERVEIQPAHLVRELESIIKNTFPKNIRLKFAIPKHTWMILGDPTQVHQILLNLCVNARDAMPNGGNLTIGVENCELDEQYVAMNLQAKVGRYVNIRVTDSGTGIPQDILDKIFDPFFTTKEVNEGTGLGLSTVMAIVKSHGGTINVYSEPGRGTTFNVYLPAVELSSAAQQLLTQEISVPRGKGETVLVVDDEASILTITSQTLEAFGYRVLAATDGAEAVAVYAEHKNEIAVVLTDMSMPIMDGAAVIRALMKINPAIKIIAVSGLTANGEVAKVSGLAVKHFLTKPYTSETLLKLMRKILDET